MDKATIFKQLMATRLLEQLLKTEPLLFVGDQDTLALLKEAFEAKAEHRFLVWRPDLSPSDWAALLPSAESRVVVAALQAEQAIFEAVQAQLSMPVLRLFADLFTNLVAERSLLEPTQDHQLQPSSLSYAILTTPRSGSTYLCELLRATKRAGNPTEHLRQATVMLAQFCGFDYLRFLRNQMKYQTTPNGVFGTKFISHFLFDLQDCPSPSGSFDDIFKTHISKFVYLVREDKVSQAVSALVAKKTKVWHIFRDEKQQAYEQQTQMLEVDDSDLEAVHRIYQSLLNQETQFERLFEAYQITPHVIQYEELANHPETHLTSLLEYLSISLDDLNLSSLKTQSKRLRSEFSQMLAEQYEQKYGKKQFVEF